MAYYGLEAEEYDRKYKDTVLAKRIINYFGPYFRPMIVVIIFLSLSSLSSSFVPILSRTVINILGSTRDAFYLFLVFSIIFAMNILSYVFNYFQSIYSARVVGDVVLDLRKDANAAVLNRDLSFFDKNPIGKLVSRINSDSEDFGEAISLFLQFISSILITIILIVYMMSINITLMLMFLIIVPIFFIVALLFRKVARAATLLGQRSLARVNDFVQESLSGIQIAKTFRQEAKLFKKFNLINNQAYKVNVRRALVLNFIFPILNLVEGCVLPLIIYFGGSSVLGGQISAGDFYLFLQSLWQLFFPLLSISSFWPTFQSGMSAAERIFSIIDSKPLVTQNENIKPEGIKEIIFKNLTFEYEKNKKIFDNFSLTIHAGESIAIVGHTGAGKSTLGKLLTRFYEFQQGDIIIDGVSIRNFNLQDYRKLIGYIPQIPFLWSDTIENNIKYGKPEATPEEVKWALENSSGLEWIEDLDNGLKTEISERGKLLSMGQRQLIAFARVILENPSIFILDEATASVDPFTETLIQEALDKILRGRTSIIIAHRLWTVRRVDRIIVLDHGKIVEEGNHDQLIEKCGVYAKLYNTYFRHQSLEYIEKARTLQDESELTA